jgi:hypothetical protein
MASARPSRKSEPRVTAAAVAQYKTVLRRVLDNRPSGTRQRLAHALGKNRSFISQISNPIYPVPIPAQHLETIFSVCHFAPPDRREFLDAYAQAHHTQMRLVAARQTSRSVTLSVPDLGSAERNRLLDDLLDDLVRSIARHLEQL